MHQLSTLALRLTNSGIKLSLATLLSFSLANAVEVSVTKNKNWIWFGDDKPKQTEAGTNTEVKEKDGKVSLNGPVHYYKPPSHYIDKISVDGSNAKAVLQTNQTFEIGDFTLKGNASLAVPGAYVEANCKEGCALFKVQNLNLQTINGNGQDKDMYLKFVDAQKTTITGDGTINFNKGPTNLPNSVSLGDVVVENAPNKEVTIKTDEASVEVYMTSLKVSEGASLNLGKEANDLKGKVDIKTLEVAGTLNTKNADKDKLKVDTLDVKESATIDTAQGKLSAKNVIAEAGAKNLDMILTPDTNFILTAKRSGITEDRFFDTEGTSTKLGKTLPANFKEGVSIEKNVVDNNWTKTSADFVTIVAKEKDAQGDYIANSAHTNLIHKFSNRVQATLDNSYLAHNVLLANTMALNDKMLLFKGYKDGDEIASEYEQAARAGYVKTYGDFWFDYDFATLNKYGENLSGTSNSVQMGAGIFQTNAIRAGAFFRYTNINASNNDNDNSYTGNAYNAGFYAVANLWTGGYLRGRLAYTGVGFKAGYNLRNDLVGTNLNKSLNDSFHYITTGVGLSQEGVLPRNLRGSIAFDLDHIVPLYEKYGEKDFNEHKNEMKEIIKKDSTTLISVSAMLGTKLEPNLMLFAKGQVGYALSSVDDLLNSEKDPSLPKDEKLYSYNMLVSNAGVGVAYDITKALKVSADMGVGLYGEANTDLRANFGVNYLF